MARDSGDAELDETRRAGDTFGAVLRRGGGDMVGPADVNRLYYGDCLTIMLEWPSQWVDLIYLDPPFNSNRQYNAIYKDETGRPLPDQVEAFCDMWELDDERMRAIRRMPVLMADAGIDDSAAKLWQLWLYALRGTQPRLLAYLSYMAQRLLIMRRLLKPTGLIYLHCDPTASHYVKALMDAIFGHENFLNEIIWRRTVTKGNTRVRFPRNHDVILAYGRTPEARVDAFVPYDLEDLPEKTLAQYRHVDKDGRRYTLGDLANPNQNRPNLTYEFLGITRVWRWTKERMEQAYADGLVVQPSPGAVPRLKRYLDEQRGLPLDDIWDDIPAVSGDEDMGYDTQKPLALLERIINASSDEGDIVLDPFCGCATTIEAAHNLGRRWIGIDIAIHAVKRVASVRLGQRLGLVEGQDYIVEGVPRTVEGAQDLWERDPYHFQKWAVEQSDGFVTTRRSADGGVDGRLYFAVPGEEDLQSMVIEVKGGRNVSIAHLRALHGVLDHDSALMAGLVVLHPPAQRQARNFAQFMADAGALEILGIEYPRLQVLTVEEILNGKRFMTPTLAGRHLPQPRFPGIPR